MNDDEGKVAFLIGCTLVWAYFHPIIAALLLLVVAVIFILYKLFDRFIDAVIFVAVCIGIYLFFNSSLNYGGWVGLILGYSIFVYFFIASVVDLFKKGE